MVTNADHDQNRTFTVNPRDLHELSGVRNLFEGISFPPHDQVVDEFRISDVEMRWHPNQRTGDIQHMDVYTYLEENDLLSRCLGRWELSVIQKQGADFFRRHFGVKKLYGWASVDFDEKRVPCITERRGKMVMDWPYLRLTISTRGPALLFRDE